MTAGSNEPSSEQWLGSRARSAQELRHRDGAESKHQAQSQDHHPLFTHGRS
jgi:hypothetical protein